VVAAGRRLPHVLSPLALAHPGSAGGGCGGLKGILIGGEILKSKADIRQEACKRNRFIVRKRF
jgi:hypothetical protein